MSQITDLPDELLLKITSYLKPHDMMVLALATQRLHGPAMEVAYTHVKLPPYIESSPPLLLRTLVQRPDLAAKVRSIDMSEESVWHSTVEGWTVVIKKAVKVQGLWGTYRKDCVKNIKKRDASACLGLLFLLTPNLRHFTITKQRKELSTDIARPQNFVPNGVKHIGAQILLPKLSLLSAPFGHMYDHWFSLPQLQSLEIDCTPTMGPIKPGLRTQYIRNLKVRCTTLSFWNQPLPHNGGPLMTGPAHLLSGLLESFDNLKSLAIEYTNWDKNIRAVVSGAGTGQRSVHFEEYNRRIMDWHNYASYAQVLDELKKVAPQLEELELTCTDVGERKKGPQYLFSGADMRHFTQLKRLAISQCAFVETKEVGWHQSVTGPSPLVVLPPNLEHLHITDPTLKVLDWMTGILEDRTKLSSLTEVELDFGDDIATHPFKGQVEDMNGPIQTLQDAGVAVQVLGLIENQDFGEIWEGVLVNLTV